MGFSLKPKAGNASYSQGALLYDAAITEPLSGTVNDLNVDNSSDVSVILLNATAAFTINGIAGGVANRQLELINQSGFTGTIAANAAGSQVVNQFAGAATIPTGTTVQLVYNGTLNLWCTTAGSSAGGGSPANPTGLVGLTAVPGSAVTYPRSDSSPALDVSISPTWSGVHLFQRTFDGLFTTSFFNPSSGTHALSRISLGVTAVTTPASSGMIIGTSGVNNTDVLFSDAGLGVGGNVAFFYTTTTGVPGFVAAPMVFAVGDLTRMVIGPSTYPTYPDVKFMNLAESFKIISPTTIGNAYHSWYRANGTTRKGLIGYDSNNVNDNLRIVNSENASIILANLGGSLTLNALGNTSASGTISGSNLDSNGGAIPTALVGLTAITGSATTYTPSDSAPALSQSIAPTWTGLHVFQGNILSVSTAKTGFSIGTQTSGAIPGTMAVESSQGADGKLWEDIYNGGVHTRRLVNDAANSVTAWQVVTRSGMTVVSVAFPNCPVVLPNYTVSALPSAATVGSGATAFVTDATLGIAAGLGLTPIGSGSNKVPVYSDGSVWRIG